MGTIKRAEKSFGKDRRARHLFSRISSAIKCGCRSSMKLIMLNGKHVVRVSNLIPRDISRQIHRAIKGNVFDRRRLMIKIPRDSLTLLNRSIFVIR